MTNRALLREMGAELTLSLASNAKWHCLSLVRGERYTRVAQCCAGRHTSCTAPCRSSQVPHRGLRVAAQLLLPISRFLAEAMHSGSTVTCMAVHRLHGPVQGRTVATQQVCN